MAGTRKLNEFALTATQQKSIEAIYQHYTSGKADWLKLFTRFLHANKRIASTFGEEKSRLAIRSPVFALLMRFPPFFQLMIASHKHIFDKCESVIELKQELRSISAKAFVNADNAMTEGESKSQPRPPARYLVVDLPVEAFYRMLEEGSSAVTEILQVSESEDESGIELISLS